MGYDALLFDIDGTLLDAGKALPGAIETFAWLRQNNFPFKLITNDGNHSLEEKSDYMKKAGFDIRPEEIVSCSLALNEIAVRHSLAGQNVFVMGDLGKPVSYAQNAGMIHVSDHRQIESCKAVIVGEGYYDWHDVFQAVLNFFRNNQDALFLVPNPDSYWPNGKNGFGIGAGAKARFIAQILSEMGIMREITYLGKPHPAIFDHAINEIKFEHKCLEIRRERVLMLGDFLKSDIRGANVSGLQSGLLLTGVTRERHLAEITDRHEMPFHVFRTLA